MRVFAFWSLVALLGASPALAGQPPQPPQLAQGAQVDVAITATCDSDQAVFKIVNKGHEWPTVAKFSIYRVNGNQLVSQRRMRLTAHQEASFRVKGGGAAQKMEFGIFIEPEWYTRNFAFDQKVTC